MARERIVLDTNVLISAILSTTSVPAQSLDRALRDGQILASVATLRELTEKLLSARFDPYVPRDRREALLQRFAAVLEIVQVLQEVRECRDPDDDMFLEVAVNGRADVVVSGDRDLPGSASIPGDRDPYAHAVHHTQLNHRRRVGVPHTAAGWPPLPVCGRNARVLDGFARLAPGVSVTHAQAELDPLAARLETDLPDVDRAVGVTIAPFTGDDRGLTPFFRALMGSVAFLLLIGREVIDRYKTTRAVVGFVETLRTRLIADDSDGVAFLPFPGDRSVDLAYRDPSGSVSEAQLRAVVHEILPGATLLTRQFRPFERTLGQPRFLALLLGTLGLVAIALTVVGIFGVVNHEVVRRTREVGIRIACGANAGRVRRLVLRRALVPALLGILAGGGASLWWTPTLRALLYGIEANDAATFALTGLLVVVTVAAASLPPAWRASRVDPVVALRQE